MGDLARRRSARELWISRSHVWAAGLLALLAVGVAFGAGYLVGRGEPTPAARPGFVDDAAPGELVEVLARVDASVSSDDGVHELTFPDALTSPVEGDPPPPGRFTIEIARFGAVETAQPLREHLRKAGLAAWIGVERNDGTPTYRVAVGAYPAEQAATDALQGVVDALGTFEGSAGVPHVVDQQPTP